MYRADNGSSTVASVVTTRTITAVTPSSFIVHNESGVSSGDTQWTCDAHGIASTQLNAGGGSTAGVVMNVVKSSGISLPLEADWTAGRAWDTAYDVTLSGKATGTGRITSHSTIVAQEQVAVVAGTYTAWRVDTVTTQDLSMSMGGAAARPFHFQVPTTSWYAKGVGVIKTQSSVGVAGSSSQLISYTP